jgi:tRNA 2-thiouridine synthesizing protein B
MTLHTWNKAATDAAPLAHCLALLGSADTLLLLEEGVYALLDAAFMQRLQPLLAQGTRLCALAEDLAARGLSARIPRQVEPVSYREFVALSLQHARVVNWV